MPHKRTLIPAGAGITSGLLFALALPPFNLWPLGWLYPLPLLIAVQRSKPGGALLAAYICGVIAANQGAYGVLGFSPEIWLFLFLLCPLWIVLPVAALLWIKKYVSGIASLLSAPLLWVASETLFMDVFQLPLDSGVTLARSPAALQLAAYLGSAGLTFAIVLTSALVANALLTIHEQGWRQRWRTLLLPISIPLLCTLVGGLSLPDRQTQQCLTQVEATQPVIPFQHSTSSWTNPAIRSHIRTEFQQSFQQSQRSEADLIVWPEGGSAFTNFRLGGARDNFIAAARRSGKHFFISTMDFNAQGNKFNSLFSIDPQGSVSKYDKLTPVIVAENDTTPGSTAGVIDTAWGKAGVMICFEVCFPHAARTLSAQNAAFLLVSTSDMAFGISALPELHLSTSILRAVENRRSLLHAANGGPSAIIDPYGRLTEQTRLWDKTAWRGCLSPPLASSLFTRVGYLFSTLCVWAALGLVTLATVRRSRLKQPPLSWRFPLVTTLVSLVTGICFSLLMALLSASLVGKQAATDITLERIAQSLWPSPPLDPEKAITLNTSASRGASALRFLASYYGVALDEQVLLSTAQVSAGKMSLQELADSARQLGLQAQTASQLTLADLDKEFMPSILGFGFLDYAVLLLIEDELITLFVPSMGVGSLTSEQFNKFWDGRQLRIRLPHFDFSNTR